MKAIICDRCKSVNNYKNIKNVRINQMVSISNFNGSETENYEICKKCYDELFSWTKSKNEL